MRRILSVLLALFVSVAMGAAESDTIAVAKTKRKTVFRCIGNFFTPIFKGFNTIDTAYIEPQHYNYAAMIQNTNTYEVYRLESKSGQSITFAPKMAFKVGPYFGWRWIFLGYTFDVNNLNADRDKTEFDLSLYSSLFGIDLYYRKTGNSYRIREANLMQGIDKYALQDVHFPGLSVGIKGFDVYYIFNHRKFSYPAAFSQSTCQKRSCGSPLAGIGYTRHDISLDYNKLEQIIKDNTAGDVQLDDDLRFNDINYVSFSVSGGYAYNWVFARNWLFAASLSAALSYKQSEGNLRSIYGSFFRDFNFKNVNIDAVGRFGLVWNNTKLFAGANAIMHSYNYNKSRFSANNNFGSINIYVGFNFGKK